MSLRWALGVTKNTHCLFRALLRPRDRDYYSNPLYETSELAIWPSVHPQSLQLWRGKLWLVHEFKLDLSLSDGLLSVDVLILWCCSFTFAANVSGILFCWCTDSNPCPNLRLFSEMDSTGSSPWRSSGGNKDNGQGVGEADAHVMFVQYQQPGTRLEHVERVLNGNSRLSVCIF